MPLLEKSLLLYLGNLLKGPSEIDLGSYAFGIEVTWEEGRGEDVLIGY